MPLITSVNFQDGPKIVEKSAGGSKVDFAPFLGRRLTGAVACSWFNDFSANRNLNLDTNAANLGAGSSMTRAIATNRVANPNTNIQQTGEPTGKFKDNTNLSQMTKYKLGAWSADASLLCSRARKSRGGLACGTRGTTNVRLDRIGWTAERTDVDSPAWHFTPTSGPNWYDCISWGKTTAHALNSNEAYGRTEEYAARLDVRRAVAWSIPNSSKLGYADCVKFRHRWVIDTFNATYVGATGNALTSSMPQSKAFLLIDEGWAAASGRCQCRTRRPCTRCPRRIPAISRRPWPTSPPTGATSSAASRQPGGHPRGLRHAGIPARPRAIARRYPEPKHLRQLFAVHFHAAPRNSRFTPRVRSDSVNWKYRKLFFSVNRTWTDEMHPGFNTVAAASRYFPNDIEYLKARTILFTNVRYQLTRHHSVFVLGDRAYASGKTWCDNSDGQIRQVENYGSQWSIGVQGDC